MREKRCGGEKRVVVWRGIGLRLVVHGGGLNWSGFLLCLKPLEEEDEVLEKW